MNTTRQKKEPSEAFLLRLLSFVQEQIEEAIKENKQHPPMLVFARVDDKTNDPEFDGVSELELPNILRFNHTKKGDMNFVTPLVKHVLNTNEADVGVFVAEGWTAQCATKEEAEAIARQGETKKHGNARSAVVVTMYTRAGEYVIINDLIEKEETRSLIRGELHMEQQLHGGMSLHNPSNAEFGVAQIGPRTRPTLH